MLAFSLALLTTAKTILCGLCNVCVYNAKLLMMLNRCKINKNNKFMIGNTTL